MVVDNLNSFLATETTGGRLSSNVKRHNVKNVTLAVDTVPETIENETVKSKVPSVSAPSAEGEILQSSNMKYFGFNELKTATRNFRPDNMVGEGSFGFVFKGWIDENSLTDAKPGTGMAIAVKRLNQEGLHGQKEWLAEVNSTGKLHHPNLVRLIVTAYKIAAGYFQSQPLPWSLRIKIALGAAKSLAFLHSDEAKVIYGNFKTSKILLDSNYNAKLSGYGLAKEWLREDLTPEGDVYSFGVVLLEILSGRRALDANRPSGEQDLVQHARSAKKCKLHQLFDARIEGQYSSDEARKALNLAMKCLSTDSKFRPDMNEVVKLLEQLQSSSEMEDLAARASLKSYLAKIFMPIQAMYGPNRRQKNVNRISCATPT
ncbi:protein kinase APK1B chloroplastic-like isoform X2 [Prunus yedoensis var. nudiflora]|uniref:Protein kinase APK1B chloroplastic-like isoform X2 n=1 Tax=Prunus yedoensis var. nudiflora TaxID=2094558 RepID=A0A314Y3I0_PRUYE|nr:protein kinase APK1B chloroplastic-like isoform X2 [Prunus yedoensis var. nudiflora]